MSAKVFIKQQYLKSFWIVRHRHDGAVVQQHAGQRPGGKGHFEVLSTHFVLNLQVKKMLLMKKLILLGLPLLMNFYAISQANKMPAAAAKPAPATPSLKTAEDSISYAIGLSAANFFRQQNVKNINPTIVSQAIQDLLHGRNLLLSDQQANAIIMACVNRNEAEKNKLNAAAADANKKAGDAFLADNKTKAGVVSLPSGLQYQVLLAGTGPRPAATAKVKCHYHGTLLDGTVFDSSIKRGQPLEIGVDHVIPGWAEALQLMPVGSKWRLFIPSQLAYGDQQAGQDIKPGSTLIFDLELLDIVK